MAQNALMSAYFGDPVNDARIAFWSQPIKWPRDTPGHTFMARAILAAGEKAYGDDRVRHSATTRLTFPLPEHLSLYTPSHQMARAVAILIEHSKGYRERAGSGILSTDPESVYPTSREWREAVEFTRKQSNESWRSIHAFSMQTLGLVEAFVSGKVKTLTRDWQGGSLTEQPWYFWNSEQPWMRFETCRVSPSEPFARDPFTGEGLWLFVDNASFEAWLNGSKAEKPNEKLIEENIADLQARRQGGRPKKSGWDQLMGEFMRIYYEEAFNGNISEMARRLEVWGDEHLSEPISAKTIEPSLRVWSRWLPRSP